MIRFDWLAFWLGATCAAIFIYVVALAVEVARKFIGHQGPIKAPVDKSREAVLIESARTIVAQGGTCDGVHCMDCPANGKVPCTSNWNAGSAVVPWFRAYLASHGVTP